MTDDVTERIRCFLCPRRGRRVRRPLAPLAAHCHLRLLWIRQHRFAWYPDRYPRPIRPVARWRHLAIGGLCSRLGCICYPHLGLDRRHGHYYPDLPVCQRLSHRRLWITACRSRHVGPASYGSFGMSRGIESVSLSLYHLPRVCITRLYYLRSSRRLPGMTFVQQSGAETVLTTDKKLHTNKDKETDQ